MAAGVSVTILGTAQDGGIPQAGCSCERCKEAHKDLELRKYPVSLGILGADGSKHIVEVTKNLCEQLMIWTPDANELFIPETVSITHLHLGHVEGIGQFGKPVMALKEVDIFLSRDNKNIFDGINVGLSKLVGRLSLSSLKLQDGQIHTYSLAMVVTGVISVFILVILG